VRVRSRVTCIRRSGLRTSVGQISCFFNHLRLETIHKDSVTYNNVESVLLIHVMIKSVPLISRLLNLLNF
jgi:hypothetical protein